MKHIKLLAKTSERCATQNRFDVSPPCALYQSTGGEESPFSPENPPGQERRIPGGRYTGFDTTADAKHVVAGRTDKPTLYLTPS
jgi:hypothetical protein